MSRIRGKNTTPEQIIFSVLSREGISFSRHAADLPGRPDVVLRRAKLAVFIDGDFWHGWRFPLWKHKLSEKWQDKIEAHAQTRPKELRQTPSPWLESNPNMGASNRKIARRLSCANFEGSYCVRC